MHSSPQPVQCPQSVQWDLFCLMVRTLDLVHETPTPCRSSRTAVWGMFLAPSILDSVNNVTTPTKGSFAAHQMLAETEPPEMDNVLCGNTPEEMWTNCMPSHPIIEKWPLSSIESTKIHWVFLSEGFLNKSNDSKTYCVIRSHYSMIDSTPELETWSILDSLQEAQVGALLSW